MKNILQTTKIITLAVFLTLGLSYVYAWTAPTQTAPTGNVSAPLNTSGTDQTKLGSLSFASFLDSNNPLFFANPNADSVLADIYLKPNASSTQTGSLYATGDVCSNSTGTGTGVCLNAVGGGGGGGGGSNYGSGVDGAYVLDGTQATVSGLFTKDSATSYTLQRDAFFTNLTISSGVTLNPGGYRVFVKGTLTLSGKIARNGASGDSGGAAQPAGYLPAGIAGVSGGAGGTTSTTCPNGCYTTGAPGVAGTSGLSVTNSIGVGGPGASGTAGRGGKSSDPGSPEGWVGAGGGGGGSVTGLSPAWGSMQNLQSAILWRLFPEGSSPIAFKGNAGSGGGGGGGAGKDIWG
ncbi:MAG: hypothetical protein PHS95_01250, partial [Candidatus Pacebacteria bacterium]|nr:hypothetical protein [Candidatus Paceibacterota bacterium]